MQENYDFVIVGAGSAGCVLAERLSRDPGAQVLLIEAGGWDWNPLVHIPIGARKMMELGMYQWGDVSEPNPDAADQRMIVPHGRLIGGTSSINFFAHVRGNPLDYQRWAEQGATGWGYEDVLPFFRECETWAGGADAWRGGTGPLGAQHPLVRDRLAEGWFAAARGAGQPFTLDYNGKQNEGFALIQYSLRGGRRSSAAVAFLRPALKRRNLKVLTRAHATRVLFKGTKAVGVEYRHRGQSKTVKSRSRTILCLGAINTPHLLMLSGVGPAGHLRSMGIQALIDLPVGQNLEDHLAYPLQWRRKQRDPFHRSLRLDKVAINMLRAHFLRSGPVSNLPGAVFAFLKTEASLAQPDIQLVCPFVSADANYWLPLVNAPGNGNFLAKVNLLSQKSRGEILLGSADPMARPRIRYNSLSHPDDMATMKRAYRMTMDVVERPEFAEFRAERMLPAKPLATDGDLEDFIRRNSSQQYHPASTCPMGRDGQAVLNPDMGVKGAEGLSVVDASAMPHLIAGNPNVVVMMMAAKAAAGWAP